MYYNENMTQIQNFKRNYLENYNWKIRQKLKNSSKNEKNSKKFVYYNENMYTHVQNFKQNFLENYNDSEHAVKTKMLHFSWTFQISTKIATFFPTRLVL